MALSAGDTTCAAGTMAGAIYDEFVAAWGSSAPGSASDDALREMAAAIAEGVVSHLLAEADVRVTVTTSDGALQRYNDGRDDVDTLAPSASRSITGVLE